jgi:hypothetical protein
VIVVFSKEVHRERMMLRTANRVKGKDRGKLGRLDGVSVRDDAIDSKARANGFASAARSNVAKRVKAMSWLNSSALMSGAAVMLWF